MMDLFKNFSIEQIIIFIILFALAVKGCITFFDWVGDRTKKAVKQANKPIELEQSIKDHDEKIVNLEKSIDSISQRIDMLIESDKDAIKAFITHQHHYFCYQKGWIDDYSLDCIEKRYNHYSKEGGNSFVQNLMTEIRALPRQQLDNIHDFKENEDE